MQDMVVNKIMMISFTNRKREPLITYNMYVKEQKKKYKQNKFHSSDNWQYDEESDAYTCPNQQTLDI